VKKLRLYLRIFVKRATGLLLVKINSKFNCSYMALSSLTYIAGISVLFIFQLIYNDYERKKITSKPSAKKFEMK